VTHRVNIFLHATPDVVAEALDSFPDVTPDEVRLALINVCRRMAQPKPKTVRDFVRRMWRRT
jgi:hypothetical protein